MLKIDKKQLQQLFDNCDDVSIKTYQTDPVVTIVYSEGLCDVKLINQLILPQLLGFGKTESSDSYEIFNHHLPLDSLDTKDENLEHNIVRLVFEGYLIASMNDGQFINSIDFTNPPHRTPSESKSESAIRGPQDGLVELISDNIALVRRRLPTNSLKYEQMLLGVRSQTKVAVLYIDDIIQDGFIDEVKQRLGRINVDAVLSASQINQLIGDNRLSLFPLLGYTSRPDFIAETLLLGRFVILIDGLPTALVGPANLFFLLKTPEDAHFTYEYVSFEQMLRILGLFIALYLPGFWVSLITYHPDQIPFNLLTTIVVNRYGVPLPPQLEIFVILILFELIKEAGARLPVSIGQTLAVVGGLIIGDAAIRSGLTSPSMLVVVATTLVTSFTLTSQALNATVSILRIFSTIIASILGVYGLLLSIILVTVYVAGLESFGISYLSPISPPQVKHGAKDILNALFRTPWTAMTKRPTMLHTKDNTRQGEDSE